MGIVGVRGDYWLTVGNPVDEPDGVFVLPVAAVDVSTLVYTGSDRTVWTITLLAKGEKFTEITGVRYSFRCTQQEVSAIQKTEYNPEKLEITSADTEKSGYISPIPDTLLENSLKFACDQRQGQPVNDERTRGFRHNDARDVRALKELATQYWTYTEAFRKLPKEQQELFKSRPDTAAPRP
jgi:hypothetical protein